MIVVDASLAVKWFLVEEFSDAAQDLAVRCRRERRSIAAPFLIDFEVTNVIRQQIVRHGATMDEALEMLDIYLTYPIALLGPPDLHVSALKIAAEFDLPASYDANYVALARGLGCSLWTDDHELLSSLRRRLPFVRWIGEFDPSEPL
jgi:predicted nucleic acid-binding protein